MLALRHLRAALPAKLPAIAVGVICIALFATCGVTSGTAAQGTTKLSFYSVLKHKGFLNNTDDLARGEGHNPFGNYSGSSVTTRSNEKLFGPFPGDEGEFEFDLYTSPDHKSKAGSVIFVCQYGLDQTALCDAAFQLRGGTLVAKGATTFGASSFSLAIIGGTHGFRSTKGLVAVQALGSDTQPQPVIRDVPMLQSQHLTLTYHPA
jgi:hypothetical protein